MVNTDGIAENERFYIVSPFGYDDDEIWIVDNGKHINFEECVDLLNELDSECNYLKEMNKNDKIAQNCLKCRRKCKRYLHTYRGEEPINECKYTLKADLTMEVNEKLSKLSKNQLEALIQEIVYKYGARADIRGFILDY